MKKVNVLKFSPLEDDFYSLNIYKYHLAERCAFQMTDQSIIGSF